MTGRPGCFRPPEAEWDALSGALGVPRDASPCLSDEGREEVVRRGGNRRLRPRGMGARRTKCPGTDPSIQVREAEAGMVRRIRRLTWPGVPHILRLLHREEVTMDKHAGNSRPRRRSPPSLSSGYGPGAGVPGAGAPRSEAVDGLHGRRYPSWHQLFPKGRLRLHEAEGGGSDGLLALPHLRRGHRPSSASGPPTTRTLLSSIRSASRSRAATSGRSRSPTSPPARTRTSRPCSSRATGIRARSRRPNPRSGSPAHPERLREGPGADQARRHEGALRPGQEQPRRLRALPEHGPVEPEHGPAL